jgi:hypothetical protein
VRVKSCQISPGRISLGGTARLIISLDSVAPPGGQEVSISSNIDGPIDTFVSLPQGLGIQQGSDQGSCTLQTATIDGAAHSATFSVGVFGQYPLVSATLQID